MPYIGNTPADKFLTLAKQNFSTSATTSYTLDSAVSSTQDIGLFINNVRQSPVDAYTVSGTALTLTSATAGTDEMYCVYLGKTVGTVSPASDSVTTAMIQSNAVNNAKMADDAIGLAELSATGTASSSTFLRGDNSWAASGGITEFDQWRLTTSFTGDAVPIASNLERVDTTGFEKIGTGMTNSSGVFSFPSTGKWWVIYTGVQDSANSENNCDYRLQVATDGSSFAAIGVSVASASAGGSNEYQSSTCSFLFDVTNTTTHKVQFAVYQADDSNSTVGNTDRNFTSMTFIRIGDT